MGRLLTSQLLCMSRLLRFSVYSTEVHTPKRLSDFAHVSGRLDSRYILRPIYLA